MAKPRAKATSPSKGRTKNSAPARTKPPHPVAAKASLAKSKQVAIEAKSGVKMKANPAAPTVGRSDKEAMDRVPPASTVAKSKPAQSSITLPENYRPSDSEPFMCPMQRQYFRIKLLNWKEEILRQTRETLQGMHDDNTQYADLSDRATFETDRALELRARDRQRKLISKIDAALARIEDGTYGYCEETGEPIGLKRLDARPIATLSLEAQERHERRERVHRGD